MLQKKNEGNFLSAEIRVVGSYTDRLLIAITTTIFKSNYDLKYRTSHHFNYKFNCVFVELCLNVFAGAITATETNVISTVLMLNSL